MDARRAFGIAKGHHEGPEKAGMGPNHQSGKGLFFTNLSMAPPPYPKYINKGDRCANITLNA